MPTLVLKLYGNPMGGHLLPAVEPNFDDLCPDLVPRERISRSAPKDDPRPSHRLGVHQTLGLRQILKLSGSMFTLAVSVLR